MQWATPSNWNPAVGAPPGADDVAIFNTAPAGATRSINLGGIARPVGTLRMNETSSPATYGFSNGSFILDRLEFNSGIFRFWNTPLAAPAATNTLTIAGSGGGTIDFTGVINAGDLNITSNSAITLYGNNTITGTLTLASHLNVGSPFPLGGGNTPIVFNTGGSLQVSAPGGKYAGGVTVNADAKFKVSGRPTTQPVPPPVDTPRDAIDFGPLTINGSTLTQDDLALGGPLWFRATTFTGSPTFTGSGTTSLGPIDGGSFMLTKTGSGELILREANNYSGGTAISGGLLTVMSPTSGLGSGPVTLSGSGKLRFMAAQTAFPSITVPAGAALGGDLTGAVYSGAGKNVTLATDAILFPTAGPTPVRGVDVASAQYWLATADKNGSYVVGDGGTSPFKGAMIGYIKPDESFQGTISEAEPGLGITVQYHGTASDGLKAAFNTTNTTTGVTFDAVQPLRIFTPFGGTATVFTFPGDPAAQSKFVASIGSQSHYTDGPEIEADETLNVSHGILSLEGHVAGTINVRNGATLNLSPSMPLNAISGMINIEAGGIVTGSYNLSTFNFAPGAQVMLREGRNTSTPGGGYALPTSGVDLVVTGFYTNALSFGGAGLIIGDGRRLFAQGLPSTAGPARVTIGPDGPFSPPSAGIHAPAGATAVTIAAATGSELRVTDAVSMPGIRLQTNDVATFTTARLNSFSDLQRLPRGQQGTITLVGDVTTGALAHQAGTLTFGDGASNATYRLGDFSVDGGVARMTSGKLVAESVAVAPTAKLDLTDETMVVTEQAVGSSSGGVYSGVQGLVQAGYKNSAWNGTGAIVTSAPLAIAGLTTIAVAPAGHTAHAGGTFAGVSVADDDVLLMYTYAGDLNLDGRIDAQDYGIIDNWVQFPGSHGYFNGDINYDGVIDAADYGVIDNSIQLQGAPLSPAAGGAGVAGVTAVPEPAGVIGLVGAAAAASARRRRCRRGGR